MDSLNKTAQSQGCAPIKTSINHQDKLSYGKRKVKQLHTAVNAKCAHALDLPVGEFESTDDGDTESCRDLERLIALLKEKLKTATRQEKIKLLSLAPESWTQQKTLREFSVTTHNYCEES